LKIIITEEKVSVYVAAYLFEEDSQLALGWSFEEDLPAQYYNYFLIAIESILSQDLNLLRLYPDLLVW
jgi:hypothetical protein